MSRCASSPSLVNSSRPEVLTSSRPTTIQRPLPGGGSRVEDGGTAFRITARGHLAEWLVIQQHLGGGRGAGEVERAAIEADLVAVRGTVPQRCRRGH